MKSCFFKKNYHFIAIFVRLKFVCNRKITQINNKNSQTFVVIIGV